MKQVNLNMSVPYINKDLFLAHTRFLKIKRSWIDWSSSLITAGWIQILYSTYISHFLGLAADYLGHAFSSYDRSIPPATNSSYLSKPPERKDTLVWSFGQSKSHGNLHQWSRVLYYLWDDGKREGKNEYLQNNNNLP